MGGVHVPANSEGTNKWYGAIPAVPQLIHFICCMNNILQHDGQASVKLLHKCLSLRHARPLSDSGALQGVNQTDSQCLTTDVGSIQGCQSSPS